MRTAGAYKSLCPREKQLLSDLAEKVALLVAKPEKAECFRKSLKEFGEKWQAYKTAQDARRKGKWQPSMGKPDDPLATIWPRSDGQPLLGGVFRLPYCGGAIRGVLGAYALLAIIHDKVLPKCPPITTGILPKELADRIWRDLVTGACNEGTLPGTPKWVIPTSLLEAFLQNVNADIEGNSAPEKGTEQEPVVGGSKAALTQPLASAAGPPGGGAKQSAVFAKGRVYDAWRNIEEILKAASDHVWIEDAYINGDVVSLFGSVPEQLPVRVLTKKLFEGADPSLKRLGQQRQGRLEVKTTGQIHPRRIFVDQRVWESGDSLSQIAVKTASTVNEITSPEGVAKLQTDFESRWQSANGRYCNDKG